ncbi:shikimate kinase [Formosa sp. Hel1_31_208]|uniref:shikimate kinase n=1 Tax=Formosa sp. Hel1_31_208 TaxID=1798225 RepID=UPI00087CE446|nr:shikimate kinase [Formosa sp. Hel1_31_208]SDS57355.1 shikimate kinase [Formosa sp. Hel1_31_208]
MTLFLIGYMGSGKSVVGEKLAEVLNYNYQDFDRYIESKENSTISHIFNNKGEIYFRKAEAIYLEDVTSLSHTVVSLGGGTPCYGNNMEALLTNKDAVTIYLKANIPTLSQRLFEQKTHRPLIAHLNSKEELQEFIGKHLFERAPFYEQSQISVKTDGRSIDDVVQDIMLQLF